MVSRLWISFIAASAVLIIVMACSEFSTAWFRLATWARSFSEIERPAGSSEAELMRSPEDRRSRDRFILKSLFVRWRQALSAPVL